MGTQALMKFIPDYQHHVYRYEFFSHLVCVVVLHELSQDSIAFTLNTERTVATI